MDSPGSTSSFESFLASPLLWGVICIVTAAIALAGRLDVAVAKWVLVVAWAMAAFSVYRSAPILRQPLVPRLLFVMLLASMIGLCLYGISVWMSEKPVDAPNATGQATPPTFRPVPSRDQIDDRSVLRSFSPAFLKHSTATTHLVDYVAWHESDEDWREGNGLLSTATYGELPHFWARPEHFAIFEARLLRYLRAGGETRRVFVLGPEVRNDATLLLLYRTLKRHEALGFHPHVHSVLDLGRAVHALNIACDMFASFNGRIAYFLRCPADGMPTMVRSIEAVIASKTQNQLMRLWHSSTPAADFFARHSLEIPDELLQTIRRDIETIEDIAFKPVANW